MAKRSSFNMSGEVRTLLRQNDKLSGPEVYEILKKKAPGKSINKNSCLVAFANARKKLGISGRKKGRRNAPRPAKVTSVTVSLSALRSARELLDRTGGDVAKATAVLKEMKALQK